jgi:hypothetical protein
MPPWRPGAHPLIESEAPQVLVRPNSLCLVHNLIAVILVTLLRIPFSTATRPLPTHQGLAHPECQRKEIGVVETCLTYKYRQLSILFCCRRDRILLVLTIHPFPSILQSCDTLTVHINKYERQTLLS